MNSNEALRKTFHILLGDGQEKVPGLEAGIEETVVEMMGHKVWMKLHEAKNGQVTVVAFYHSRQSAMIPGFGFGFVSFACTPDERTDRYTGTIKLVEQNDNNPLSGEGKEVVATMCRTLHFCGATVAAEQAEQSN